MGLQGLLIADIAEAAKQGGRQDLLMNAAGQISAPRSTKSPRRRTSSKRWSAKAVEVFTSRLPANVKAAVTA